MNGQINLLTDTQIEMGGIYSVPGEGFVVELHQEGQTALYDKQGLQFRILQRKQSGLDTSCEEQALTHINNLGPGFDRW